MLLYALWLACTSQVVWFQNSWPSNRQFQSALSPSRQSYRTQLTLSAWSCCDQALPIRSSPRAVLSSYFSTSGRTPLSTPSGMVGHVGHGRGGFVYPRTPRSVRQQARRLSSIRMEPTGQRMLRKMKQENLQECGWPCITRSSAGLICLRSRRTRKRLCIWDALCS